MLQFEIVEEFSIDSEVNDETVEVALRRLLNHKLTRYSPSPYCLDPLVGSVHYPQCGIDEKRAREEAARFLAKHVKGIALLLD